MKLMPASRALATIRAEVASSVGPPNIMVPRQIGEIFRPLRPSGRYFIWWGPYQRDGQSLKLAATEVSSLSLWERVGGEGLRSMSSAVTPHPALRADLSQWERCDGDRSTRSLV